MKASTVLTITAVVIVVISGLVIADFVFGIPILRSLPITKEISCSYPITIRGDSMTPALKNGEQVIFNRCLENVNQIAPRTIVVFEERGIRIGRVISRESDDNGLFYKIAREQDTEIFEVRPDRIKAIKN